MPSMDRDRGGPPGVKLPEQQPTQPLQPKKSGFSRQSLLIAGVAVVLLVVLATFFIVFTIGAARTPAQAVAGALDEGFALQQELVRVSLAQVINPTAEGEEAPPAVDKSGERSVYFFISNEQLACALLDRKAAGYNVQLVAGHLPLTGDKDGAWMAPSGGNNNEYLVFGVLYNAAKTKVEVEGNPAVIVDTGRYRLWYYMGVGGTGINSESVVYK